MKKGDRILAVCILIVGICGLLAIRLSDRGPGAVLNVMVDGELYASYDLAEDQTVELTLDGGDNTFQIQDGEVKMLSADCPDQYCVQHAAISDHNETIICLPHRLVLEIHGGGDGDVDA